ncbi:hypothetical protein HK096_010897 [Nowakowskiella sp. JEL0078]|nr:hypothetical protein HK096_010897 [Nowakowskiella sp. JEL0078]
MKFRGQIYIPAINWMLCVATIAVTLIFNNTVSLGNAYGLCVTIVTFITTIIVSLVALIVWRWNVFVVGFFFLFFAFLDFVYLSSTLLKIAQGAWFTLAIGIIFTSFMLLWHWGKENQWEYEKNTSRKLTDIVSVVREDSSSSVETDHIYGLQLVGSDTPIVKFEGLGVFFDQSGFNAPQVYSHFVENFAVIHSVVVFVHFRQVNVPTIPKDERVAVFPTELQNHYRLIISRGYADIQPFAKNGKSSGEDLTSLIVDSIIEALTESKDTNSKVRHVRNAVAHHVSYMIGKASFEPKAESSRLRKLGLSIFGFIRNNVRNGKVYISDVPKAKLVEIGMTYEI